jgi:formate-dependent nitrite reductase membrane component NrfD
MRRGHIHPIRNVRHLRPQEEWRVIIAVDLYLAGMGAGSFIIGTLIHWLGVTLNPLFILSVNILGYRLDLSKVPIFWGPIMVSIAAPFLIVDLGIKRRFMYACLNPRTSWVARGFLILSTFIVFGLVLLTKSVLPFEWLHAESALWHIPEVIAFVFAFGTAIYTGILLKATKSIPLWNTYLLPLLFLVSALSTGSMAIILSTLGTGLFSHDAGALKALMGGEQILVVVEGILLYLYLYRSHRATEQGKDSVRLLLFGEKKLIFWGGIVLLGFIFPVILKNIASFFHGNVVLIFVSGMIMLCGGFFLRLGVLSAGIKEQIPMQRLIEIQYDMRAIKIKGLPGKGSHNPKTHEIR